MRYFVRVKIPRNKLRAKMLSNNQLKKRKKKDREKKKQKPKQKSKQTKNKQTKKRKFVQCGKIVAYRKINLRLKSLRKWQAIIIT